MVVLLVLLFFAVFITIDYLKTMHRHLRLDAQYRSRVHGTMYTTPGYEALGALAQDGPSIDKSEQK